MTKPHIQGVIRRTVIPAGKRVSGKERGEWMKLTDEEAALIRRLRQARTSR